MRTGNTLSITVRSLGRWQTFWLLCRIGCTNWALMLAIDLLKEWLNAANRVVTALLFEPK